MLSYINKTHAVWRPILAGLVLILASGCAVNPVTGKKELQLVSESAEIAIGTQNYAPTQQTQGGRYVVDPGVEAYVQEVGQRLAKVSDRPQLPYEFVVLNSSVPNAWAMPGGKIAVNRGLLLEMGSEAELAAVLSHEIVHAAARHGASSMEQGMLLQAGLAGVGAAASNSQYRDLWLGAAAVGANLISQRYSREHELESDHYGMSYMSRAGYDPAAAVSLQETFVRLEQGRNSDWLEGLFASHPPSPERVAANRAYAGQLPPGGRVGRDEYRTRIAGLVKAKPAYAAYDKGRVALDKGDAGQALRLADEALRIEPREALFYGLRGDALAKQGKPREAKGEYDRALARNPDFYEFHLKKGLLAEQLGLRQEAARELAQSNRLLPTAPAHYVLGRLALGAGRQDEAIQHFSAASASKSTLGRQAGLALARLELPRNPAKYLELGLLRSPQGTLIVRLANRAPLGVRNVAIRVRLVQGNRVTAEETVFARAAAAGQQVDLGTRIPVPADARTRVLAEVVSAEPGG